MVSRAPLFRLYPFSFDKSRLLRCHIYSAGREDVDQVAGESTGGIFVLDRQQLRARGTRNIFTRSLVSFFPFPRIVAMLDKRLEP